MKSLPNVPALALLLSLSLAAPARGEAAAPGPAWTKASLSQARYVILDPRIEGNRNVVNDEQRAGILSAMRRDSAGAIKRRYPGATIVADPQTPGAVRVTPVLVAPGSLVPWAKLGARLDFDLPGGQRVTLGDTFGVLVLWQHQADAANYLYNQLAKKLP